MLVRDDQSLKTVLPKLDCPRDNFNKLISLVYKNGAYWAYHSRTLYTNKGEVDSEFNHFEQAWQVVRLAN